LRSGWPERPRRCRREKSIQEARSCLSKAKDSLETQVNEPEMQQERGKNAADEARKAKLALAKRPQPKDKRGC